MEATHFTSRRRRPCLITPPQVRTWLPPIKSRIRNKPMHSRIIVTPAKAGVQGAAAGLAACSSQGQTLDSRFRGNDELSPQ
jgi:hypothetical protein